MRPLVLKLGGELVETNESRARLAAFVAAAAARRPMTVVHGGGRAVDAELDRRGIRPSKVDGLRVTDADTLDVVVAVLAGLANTQLVAALVAAGVRAVGLTGVDAGLGQARRVSAHRTAAGGTADLGFVGDPVASDPALVRLLMERGYVPVIASIGVEQGAGHGVAVEPQLLNVNADVMVCRLAAALGDCDLTIAGATAGVLDDGGQSIPTLESEDVDRLIRGGTATAGMIVKLEAARAALAAGVASVRIIDGRRLGPTDGVETAPGTRLVTKEVTRP
jgi:acetylglutamate kinase